jgi:hypothetical protein
LLVTVTECTTPSDVAALTSVLRDRQQEQREKVRA